jgi:hypothetical protein
VTTIFTVVGEHSEDPDHLLLLGSDGVHYDYALPDGPTTPIEPDEAWAVDENPPPAEEVAG